MPLLSRGPVSGRKSCPGRHEDKGSTQQCTCARSSLRVRRWRWLHLPREASGAERLWKRRRAQPAALPSSPSLPPGGLGAAGLPIRGSFDQSPSTHRRVAGGETFAVPGAAKHPHPAQPDPLLLAALARRLQLMLPKWHCCFSSKKDFSRDKHRSPVRRMSH